MSGGLKRGSPLTKASVVAKRVRALRESAGMSQVALAEALTCHGWEMQTQTLVQRLEAGTRSISVDELYLLAAALKVSAEALLHTPVCDACSDAPPRGFACRSCGAEA